MPFFAKWFSPALVPVARAASKDQCQPVRLTRLLEALGKGRTDLLRAPLSNEAGHRYCGAVGHQVHGVLHRRHFDAARPEALCVSEEASRSGCRRDLREDT